LAAVDVVALNDLDRTRRRALGALLARAEAADEHPPLPEPQSLAIVRPRGTDPEIRAVLSEREDTVVGFALLSPARDGTTVLHVVTDPFERSRDDGELVSRLVSRAVAEAPASGALHLWAMQAGPADDALARRHGFTPERDLLQMRVPLPLPPAVVDATRPVVTRPFVPGQDDEAWLWTNNRAFAGHPEQGSWTLDQLRDRLAADWVDLDGFLVADDPDGVGLLGSCWTKIHQDRTPILGEIYIIAVDPAHHGHGWGRALTVAGLQFMAGSGVPVGMLYADATNVSAVALYRALGFTVDHVDRSYRRDGPVS
jgi:mycothiol synthase